MTVSEFKLKISEEIKALLPEQKLTSLIQVFNQLDANQDSKIELDEFLDITLAKEKIRLTEKFQAADTDKDGSVDFEEFLAVAEPYFQILKRFRELDLDQNGLLSIEEALNIADQLVLPLSPPQIKAIMAEVDRDGDRQITYYEYLGVITHIGFQ